ncbi:hypothetical protein Efla_003617 [Eimeria flavescens]
MHSPPPQLPEALPSAELFPTQPSGPETGPAAHSGLPSRHHSSSSHLSFGSHEALEALAAAMHRLTLSSQVSQAPAMTAVGPSSAASASFYDAPLKGLKYPTYGRRRTGIEPVPCQPHTCQCYLSALLARLALAHPPCFSPFHMLCRFSYNELSSSNRSQRLLDNWTAFKPALRRRFTSVERRFNRHPEASLGAPQLHSTDNLPLDEIEEACIREREAEFVHVWSSRAPVFQQKPQQTQQQSAGRQRPCPICATDDPAPVSSARSVKNPSISAASRTQLYVDKLSGTTVPSNSAPLIKTNSLIDSPKQLVVEGTVNRNPITFLLDGGTDRSIMSRAVALTNGITVHPLDPPIATLFANNSSKVIRLATEPLQLQCQGPLCNPLSPAHRTARQDRFGRYPAANEAYCNYVSTIQKLPEEAQPLAIPPAVLLILQDFPDIQKEPTTLPIPRKHQHAIPLYPDAELTQRDKFRLPLIDVLIDKMSKSKAFSRLDLQNGFYQIPTSGNAFHLNLSKCSFDADCIDFLGFQISPAGVQPLTGNASSIIAMPSTFSSQTGICFDKVAPLALTALLHSQLSQAPRLSIIRCSTQLQDRRARWMDLCTQFSVKVEHISGKDNVVADLLRRLPETAEISASAGQTFLFETTMFTSAKLGFTFQALCTSYAPDRRAPRLVLPGTPRARQKDGISLPWVLLASLSQDVEVYAKSCDICMRNKVTRHPVAPPSSPITVPSRWHTVSLDVLALFISNSPATPGGNTCILVFMDKQKKMLRLAACLQQLSAERAATLFIEHVFRHHGLPERLLSDQGPQFTRTFWKHVFSALQTKVSNTTNYYPQGNGQVERTNRSTLERLRALVNSRKDDWQAYLHFLNLPTIAPSTLQPKPLHSSSRMDTTQQQLPLCSIRSFRRIFSENAAAFLDKLHLAIAAAHFCVNTANEKV